MKELGGLVRHNGWILHIPPGMRFTWPVYPFNPYKDKPETELGPCNRDAIDTT